MPSPTATATDAGAATGATSARRLADALRARFRIDLVSCVGFREFERLIAEAIAEAVAEAISADRRLDP